MKKIVCIVIGVLGFILILWLVYTLRLGRGDFSNNLWGPAYLLWHGQSPYNIHLLFDDRNAIWFPQAIGFFALVGLLPEYQAANVWLIVNLALLLGLVWYLFRQAGQAKPKPLLLGILAAAVYLFPPTIRHLALGQIDILFVTAVLAGIYYFEKQQFVLGGFFFALALVKPQLCVIIFPGIMLYQLLYQKAWRNTLRLFAAMCFFCLVLSAPLWFGSSNWTVNFIINLRSNPNWSQPNIFSMLRNNWGVSGVGFWLILYTAGLYASLRIWQRYKPTKAVLWSLAFTTIVSPYIWSWDFVLLLPLFIDTAIRLSTRISRITLFISYMGCMVLFVMVLQFIDISDDAFWWLPYILILGIVLSIQLDKKRLPFDKLNSRVGQSSV